MAEESQIEGYLVRKVKEIGGLCWKFVSPGNVGVPDRLCLFLKGKALFVEVKSPGKKLRKIQLYRKKQLEEMGFKVYVIDSKEKVEVLINEIQSL